MHPMSVPMGRGFVLAGIVVVAFAGSYLGKRTLLERKPVGSGAAHGGACRRIVSLAPNITETLFALGLGDRIVGVTRYCTYPPAARTRARVGGYFHPDYEAIIALQPDLVILLTDHRRPKRNLEDLGLRTLVVKNKSISDVMESIETMGTVCGARERAGELLEDIRARMERIRELTAGLPRPRVLISVERDVGSGSVESASISGREGFHGKMIELAGGVNAYGGSVEFPRLSGEGLIRLDPQVIIDLVPDAAGRGLEAASILRDWESISRIDAVRRGRVHVFGDDYMVIPGPRFILILEEMARVIHPEVKWSRR